MVSQLQILPITRLSTTGNDVSTISYNRNDNNYNHLPAHHINLPFNGIPPTHTHTHTHAHTHTHTHTASHDEAPHTSPLDHLATHIIPSSSHQLTSDFTRKFVHQLLL